MIIWRGFMHFLKRGFGKAKKNSVNSKFMISTIQKYFKQVNMIECMGMGPIRQVPPSSIIQISKLIDWIYKNLKIWLSCLTIPPSSLSYSGFYCPLLLQLSPTVTSTQVPAPPAPYVMLDTTSQEAEHPALPMTAREWLNVPSVIAPLHASGVILDTSSTQEGLPAPKSHVMIPAAISARVHQQAHATAAFKPTMWKLPIIVPSAMAPSRNARSAPTQAPSPAPLAQVDTTPTHQHHARPAQVAKQTATTATQPELEVFGVGTA